jgi:hypothetical protein
MYTCKSTPQVDWILCACIRFVVSMIHFGRIVVTIMVVKKIYGYVWFEGST